MYLLKISYISLSSLSLFASFFFRQLETEFARCLKNPPQLRYLIAFPLVSSEFLNASTRFCPEEVSAEFMFDNFYYIYILAYSYW